MLEAAGIYREASECFLRSGSTKAAIDCYILHNQWKEALTLAEQHSFYQVEGIFTRLTAKLAQDPRISKKLEAVELFRAADRPQDAAMLIAEIAEMTAREKCDPLMAKKLQVLAALEVERHRKQQHVSLNSTVNTSGLAKSTLATFNTMMMTSLDTQSSGLSKRASNAFSNAWRGAAAYHYFTLAQRQLSTGTFFYVF
jgi:WD repeat-containing protein 35